MPRKTPLFHKGHYNVIAAQFSEGFKSYTAKHPLNKERVNKTAALVDLALALAKRFAEDNEAFDPHKFLDACSGDVDLYPLSELWETYNA